MKSLSYLNYCVICFVYLTTCNDAFSVIAPLIHHHSMGVVGSKSVCTQRPSRVVVKTRTSLHAIKKDSSNKTKKQNSTEKTAKKKVNDPLELFLAYATPWRNPNSIFVYMLLTLYILGSITESQRGM